MLQRLMTVPGDADARRRGRTIITICLMLFGLNLVRTPLALLADIGPSQTLPATLLGVAGALASIGLVRRGQTTLAAWIVILVGLVVISATPLLMGQLIITIFFLTIPVFLAGIILRPWHVWLVTALVLADLALLTYFTTGSDWHGGEMPLLLTLVALVCAVSVIGFTGARINAAVMQESSDARRAAEQAAWHLEDLNATLEDRINAKTAEIQQALREVEARAAAQADLLRENAAQRAAIRELSVPVLPVNHDTLIMPLIGALDTERLQAVQQRALSAVVQRRARHLIIDITGIPVVDTQVAQGLIEVVQAARLLGCTPILVGIRPEVAQTLVALGIDLRSVRTAASLQSALGGMV
ncbi:MAG: STAS domain-containing protein [Candidatus Viridilinea halotolerans]|uniref:STAS domain-containing protein n=1 Tax=Candidatus Viridilinea halotolerans TaxID=2491704 RepID=A0A426TT90_9CHLR|nr:MAG: STAS domain-containing protein [Candidatus Viridilinea halotolerans]